MVKHIKILDLDNIEIIFNGNMLVSVELPNGYTYSIRLITPKNLSKIMDENKSDFVYPTNPVVVVKKLTKRVIVETITIIAEDDAVGLKSNDQSLQLDIKTLNVLKDCSIARNELLNQLFEEGESVDLDDYNLIDFIYIKNED